MYPNPSRHQPTRPVPNHLPFSPPNGIKYEDGDEKLLCKQTPIPLWNIHPCLLGSPDRYFLPPMFHLGWAVGEFLEIVIYSEEDRKGEPIWESIFCIPDGIIKDFNIPEELHECVQVSEVLRHDGVTSSVMQRFFNGEPPQWHLDPWYWRWEQKLARVLSPSEAREWAMKMDAREAALEKLKDIHISA
ncbi:hypothetical protein BDN71DRAFT_1514052 [Pleurotus eryngii]|uniref:Uncharacterized protein n=1 Tax=Pleurotus eryngii TaxID=5323 RepID=A0A9P5ZIQ6_PLEER|nr:hypothetical protein BDN71DRAFT_1514052 [Pleurotus eryngii]